ncbi:hypothetical protein DNTS_013513 [Danionella cerebrum]|uniref:DNA endonuclease RBBP8 n=1 Tax=Danionella cerebrum TaxID=2873325 RepID=A0A553QN22_9TELE|nr:hypothetical protein DNTS_013513 [Danionella translucida]
MTTPDLSPTSSSDSREKLQEFLGAVRDLHDAALQELQAKITKLKKERCLDAQKLSEFHKKNQLLREHQKILQEKIRQLEDRVQSGPCGCCRVAEKLKKKASSETEEENQKTLSVVADLEAERKALKDENQRLHLELERLQPSDSPQNSFSEAEEGMIPDSPHRPLSLPVSSKMKRRKEQNHARYAEAPLSLSHPETKRKDSSTSSGHNGVLVPETCEIDVIQEPHTKKHSRIVVPETCHVDGVPDQSEDVDAEDLYSAQPTEQNQPSESHDHTDTVTAVVNNESPSILRHPLGLRGLHENPHTSPCVPVKGKRKHSDATKAGDLDPDDPDETEIKGMMFASTPANAQMQSRNKEMFMEPDQIDVAHINQDSKRKCLGQQRPQKSSLHNHNVPYPYGADLDQYDTERSPQLEARECETLDTDCTFVSHSLLLRGQKRKERTQITGIGQKANDSLADIFDKTGYGDYESCPQEESLDIEQKATFVEEGEEDDQEFRRPAEKKPLSNRSFACVEVVRKKDERRKLKGHYCKECEVYYAHLPEEEKLKKLSSCSRHRYRYIPPSTPENFWEVGFPSTQTCVERGYINEEENPDVRIRRRRPYLAMFSPKAKSQKQKQ